MSRTKFYVSWKGARDLVRGATINLGLKTSMIKVLFIFGQKSMLNENSFLVMFPISVTLNGDNRSIYC